MIPEILHEDNHLLVVVKPPDVPVMADSSGDPDMLTLLKDFLKKRDGKPGNVFLGLVHRLDRPVGGVMVFAKTSKAASRLSAQIRERETGKEYLAVVLGTPAREEARLCDHLLKDERTRRVSIVEASAPGAREAILHYHVVESRNGCSLLRVRILTGRAHQIRVQLAAIGTPIVGDRRYGSPSPEEFRSNPSDPAAPALSGIHSGSIGLWCVTMEVNHPTGGQRMQFVCDPPDAPPWNLFAGGTRGSSV